jgi:Integrator complex subunit 3 N-terminal
LLSKKAFRTLSFILKDRYRSITQKLVYLVGNTKFQSLFPSVRKQITWLIGKLTSAHSLVDLNPELHISALKQIRGGDLSQDNVALTQAMIEMFDKHYDLVITIPRLTRHIIFKVTRIAQDHKPHSILLSMEARLVQKLVKARVIYLY